MSKQFKSKGHLAWVHEFQCCLTATGECSGPIHAHHLLKPWNGGRGMGMKANDRNVVPLCMSHHDELHNRYGNEHQFFADKAFDEDWGKKVATVLWITSPYNQDGATNDFGTRC